MSASENIAPFLVSQYPFNWASLNIAHLPAALDEGLRLAKLKLAKLEALPLEQASYETFCHPLEYLSEELSRAWGICEHLSSVADSPAIREIQDKYTPIITEFYAQVGLSSGLYQRARAVADSANFKRLNALQQRYVTLTVRDFQTSGASLPQAQKAELLEVKKQLSIATQNYTKHTLDALNSYEKLIPLSEAATTLRGLTPAGLAMAQSSAKSVGKEGFYRFTLHQPSLLSVLDYAENRALREEIWRAYNSLCVEGPFATLGLVEQILALRQRKAEILGYDNFAELTTLDRMLKPPAKIKSFLEELYTRAHPKALEDFRQITEFKKSLGDTTPYEPWDVSFYLEKLQQKLFNLSTEALRPYFEFHASLNAIFTLCQTLFGIRFQKVEGHQGWHPSVDYYEVFQDSTGRHIGGFYTDFFPRKEKRSGAWMGGLLSGRPQPDGTLSPIVGTICGNFRPPTPDTPSLLSLEEVRTLFHEFGHLLHGLLTTIPIPSLAGTSVPWDFVELPSQLMENYCYSRQYLPTLARHYQSGQTLDSDTIDRLIRSRKFYAASYCLRQLSFASTDLHIHTTPISQLKTPSLLENIRSFGERFRMPFPTRPHSIIHRFSHIFGDPVGYASGYYSYKWSEILESDVWSKFEEDGILNPATGTNYLQKILSRGNSAEPMELFVAYRGREPSPEAYLRKEGLTQ